MNSEQFDYVAKALRILDLTEAKGFAPNQSNGEAGFPKLDDLASQVGVSPFHLQRLFVEGVGISPKDYLAAKAHSFAQSHGASNLFDLALETGQSSPSRVHDLFLKMEAMTPAESQQGGRGLTINWAEVETPLGNAVIGKTLRGICCFQFLEPGQRGEAILKASWPNATLHESPEALEFETEEINRRLAGLGPSKTLGLVMKGSSIRVQVWKAVINIPNGETSTYQKIAEQIGVPKAARAVGGCIGANDIAYLIPCHRVIKSNGSLSGYRWGIERKKALLAREVSQAFLG